MADEASRDPVVRQLREQIAETDRAIVAALNERLELVARLREHKAANGYAFVDRAREQALANHLAETNTGPLSREGLREFHAVLLDLTKREVAGTDARVEPEQRGS